MTAEWEAMLKAAVLNLEQTRRNPHNGIVEMLRAYQTLEKVARQAVGIGE